MNFGSPQEQFTTSACYVGLGIDFYCKFSINKIAEKFGIILKSPVEVVDEEGFEPDSDKFYIVKSYGYGKQRYRFYTDKLIYTKARIALISAFEVIKEFGYTDSTCIVNADISFDKYIFQNQNPIDLRNLNILKFILSFNEDMIYRFFPKQKDSIYVKSIKNILPQNKFYRAENVNLSNFNYILPNMKFYGVIFDNIKDGCVRMRYIGGEEYEYNASGALDAISIFIESLIKALQSPEYNQNDKDKLKKIISSSERVLTAYEDSNKFKEMYPEIKLTVDLDENDQILKSKYVKFRDKIFDLLAGSDITKGEINYDSALSKIQAKNLKGHIYEITKWEFIDCELTVGYAEDCNFFECKLENSSINLSNLYRYSVIKKSKIKDTYINRTCEVIDSFISGGQSMIDSKVVRGKIIGGRIGNHSIISPETETENYTKVYTK